MTKAELEAKLKGGASLEDAFPYRTDGQDCDICKKANLDFEHMDNIVYIPDLGMNSIDYTKRNLESDWEIGNIVSNAYTTRDFLDEAYGNRKCAEDLFAFVDWQHLNIQDLIDCTDDDEAKELYGETWDEMKARCFGNV